MAEVTAPPGLAGQTGRSRRASSRLIKFVRRWPLIPGIILFLLLVSGVFAPWIAPDSPTAAVLQERNTPPMWMDGGSIDHILGADQQGRDILSRIIHGARITLIIAGAALLIGGSVGVTLGMISGYYGGIIDEVIMRIIDVKLALPLILVALVVVITIVVVVIVLIVAVGNLKTITFTSGKIFRLIVVDDLFFFFSNFCN